MKRNLVSLVLCIACSVVWANSQVSTGVISGTVTDQSGAVAANVKVTIAKASTGITRSMNTDSSGHYRFEQLPTGLYQVNINIPNFKEVMVTDVEVHAATTTNVNIQLQIGEVSERVDVESNSIQVQTDSASLGETVEGQQVRELPLNGRSFVQLTQLVPGVSPANNFDSKNKGLLGGVDFSVNGNATTNNLYLIDGANNNDTGSNRTILVYPSLESIAEVKMLRNSYGAEYGQAAGAVISIVTRGGSNDWHGSVLYSGRNTVLNARTYFAAQRTAIANAAGQTLPYAGKDKVSRNDWAYSLGGPIIKNKLFFFWSQEWNHEIRGITQTACVPSSAEASGDFSTVTCGFASGAESLPSIPVALQAQGNPYKIANPDPAALLLVQKYPLPNQPMTNGNNWSASLPTPLKWREENIRGDFNLTKNNVFMGRFTQNTWTNNSYNAGYFGEDPFPALNDNWAQPSKSIVAKWTRTIGTNMVNAAEFTYSNNRINVTVGGTNPHNGYLYGNALQSAISAAVPPQFPNSIKRNPASIPQAWGGMGAYGSYNSYSTIAPWNNALDLYVGKDDFSKAMGKHTLKFGVLASWNGKNEDTNGSSSERPTFITGDWNTSLPVGPTDPHNCGSDGASSCYVGTGNDLANLMIPGALWGMTEISRVVRAKVRWRDREFYLADNWKLSSHVTVDLGLRWSFLDAPYQPDNQITNFQPALYDPTRSPADACNGMWRVAGTDPCAAANAQFGTNFSSGVPGPGRSLVNNSNTLIAPRAGIAWDPFGHGNTAIRAGAGEFFQRERVSRYTLVANAPFAVNASYTRALGGGTAILNPGAAPAGGIDPRAVIPSSWQWNVSIQRGLARDTTLQVGYVGNHALHQTSSWDLNQIAPVNWPAASFMTGARAQAAGFFAFNNYSTPLTWWTHQGDATYHSLQALFATRYKRLQLNAAYTWSHSISNVLLDDSSGDIGGQSFIYAANPRLDRGNSSVNRPQVFTASFNYYLPDMNQASKSVRTVFGTWELSLITTAAMGNSMTAYQGAAENTNLTIVHANGGLNSLFYNGNINLGQRPLVVPGIDCSTGHGDVVLNQSAFTLIGYHIGTIMPDMEPRGYCRGPSLLNTDLSIDKNFKMRDRVTIQFRLDLFNLFNHPNFRADGINQTPVASVNCGAPNADGMYEVCSPTNNVVSHQTLTSNFGQSTTVVGNAGREIQYGVHITF